MKKVTWVWVWVATAVTGLSAANAPEESNVTKSLKVVAVQMRSSRNLDENVSRITNSIHRSTQKGARVVVFPECTLSSYNAEVVTKLSAGQLASADQLPTGSGDCR